MTWNYRIVKERRFLNGKLQPPFYSIREVYYSGRSDKISGYSSTEQHPHGNSFHDLIDDFCKMVVAFGKPRLVVRGTGRKARLIEEKPSKKTSSRSKPGRPQK